MSEEDGRATDLSELAEATGLTRREAEVMLLLAVGKTNHEVADKLDISVKTVDSHRGKVMQKLKLDNNTLLARHALRMGWVSL